MADTQRSLAELEALLADNTNRDISAQKLRDMLTSLTAPFGRLHMTTPIETVIANANEWTKTLGTTTLGPTPHLFSMPSAGRLQYNGASPRHVFARAAFSMDAGVSNQFFDIAIALNDTPLDGYSHRKVSGGGAVAQSSAHGDAVMSNGDYLELYFRNITSDENATILNLHLFAVGTIV